MRKILTVGLFLLAATLSWAVPHDAALVPVADEQRALSALKQIATGPWVAGDWALKYVMVSGKGRDRVSVPVDIIGGWTPQTGRWQRLRFANGRQWIIKGLAIPLVWELKDDGQPGLLTPDERLNPITDRLSINWELFTMSFFNWPQIHYKGVEKVHARWCDALQTEASGGISTGAYAQALIWQDVEFGAPLEAELYDAQGQLLKTIRAVSVQKVDDKEWVLRRWEVVDAITHGKVTIEVEAVALGQKWPVTLFNETSRPSEWPVISPQAWKVFE